MPTRAARRLALTATHIDWSSGSGESLIGPIEALAMAITGRHAAFADLTGPSGGILARRLHQY